GRIGEAIEVLAPLGRPHQPTILGTSPIESLFVPETHPDLWAHALNARVVAERSLRAFRAKSEPRWLAMAHRALGVAAWSLADPSAAEEHHRAAAELAHEAGDARLEGQSLLDRAHLVRLLDANGLAVSRRLLTDAIERLSASGDAEWLARAYLDRAVVLRALGRLNEALTDLTTAAEQAERTGSPALQTWVELRTARVLVEEGRTGRARKTIERIRQRSGESPRREVDQQLTFIQAMLQEKEGRLDRARTLYEKSLLLATDAEAPGEAADTHRRLAGLEGKLGRAEEARRHLDEAERLTGTAGPPGTDPPAG
ncbi:MAG: tetratricopeptide repeat protein, partial [Thermoplasmata archaeon]|nr:tetratricopeptide repeat protein [Thermoplasmata archaeon]